MINRSRGFMVRLRPRLSPKRRASKPGTSCASRKETWRIVYRIDQDAIVIEDVLSKKTAQTPKRIVGLCQKRLEEYDNA